MDTNGMKSCLYQCEVMHHRLTPREHKFNYRVFMFYLELDEVSGLAEQLRLFSYNKFNWFSFHDRDHLQWPMTEGKNNRSVKENILLYLKEQGVTKDVTSIRLLTNVSTLGYSFNPISFYLCFDENELPVCSVAEVCNTHSEMKLYLLDADTLKEGTFRKQVSKYFYVSPFADLDSTFDFIFTIPSDNMHMRVDDYKNGKRFLLSSLSGKKRTLTDARLIRYGLRFPLQSTST